MSIEETLQNAKELRNAFKYSEAIALLTRALQRGGDARLFYSRSKAFDLMEQPEEAIKDLSSAIELDPTNPKYFYDRGSILATDLKNNADAVVDFERALELRPDDAEAHHQCCLSLLLLGRAGEGFGHAQAALRLAPHDSLTHFCLGHAFSSLDRYDEAIASLKRAVELDAGNEVFLSSLKLASRTAARVRDSEMRQSIKSAARDGQAATTLILSERYLQAHPGDVGVSLDYAEMLSDMARHEEAIRVYEHVLTVVPAGSESRWSILAEIGSVYRKWGRLPDAEPWFKKAIEASPEQTAPYILLGACLARQGKLREAAEAHRAAIANGRSDLTDEAYHNLGLVLRGQRRWADAATCFRKALEITSDYEGAAEALKDVERAMAIASEPDGSQSDEAS